MCPALCGWDCRQCPPWRGVPYSECPLYCPVCSEITAKQLSSVQHGRAQVEMVAEGGRRKEDSTHFVAICLNQPDIRERVAAFTEKCLQLHGGVSHSVSH